MKFKINNKDSLISITSGCCKCKYNSLHDNLFVTKMKLQIEDGGSLSKENIIRMKSSSAITRLTKNYIKGNQSIA